MLCRANIFTELLASNDRQIYTKPLPIYRDVGIWGMPCSSQESGQSNKSDNLE
jgi:hypothetical protein